MDSFKRIFLYIEHPVAIGVLLYGLPLAFLCTLCAYLFNRIAQKQDPNCNLVQAQDFNKKFYHSRLKSMILTQVLIAAFFAGITNWLRFGQFSWNFFFRILAIHYNPLRIIKAPPVIFWQFLLGAGIMFAITIIRSKKDKNAVGPFPSWKKYSNESTSTTTQAASTLTTSKNKPIAENSILKDLEKALARENTSIPQKQTTGTVSSAPQVQTLDTTASEDEQTTAIKKEWSSRFNIKAEDYFEVPNNGTEQIARCSDRSCPCPETSYTRGEGYIYISPNCATYRKDARSAIDATQKAQTVGGYETQEDITALFMCEEGAKLRGLNLEVAQKDARLWWYTGWLPLRATPKA